MRNKLSVESAKPNIRVGKPARIFLSWETSFVFFLTCLVVILYFFSVPLLEYVELKCWDLHFKWRGPLKPAGPVAFIGIDEQSVNREGRWPWPRRTMARLLQAADRSGALVIGLDFGFFEPDLRLRQKAILDLRAELQGKDDGRVAGDLLKRLDAMAAREDDDQILAEAVQALSAPLVLGQFFYGMESAFVPPPPPPEILDKAVCRVVLSKGETPKGKLLEQAGLEHNIPIIAKAAPYVGSFNVLPDPDGSVRWMPLILRYEGRIYPSLALQMLSAALPDLTPVIKLDENGVEGIKLGPVDIPVNTNGEILVNFYGPGYTFQHYSATALMNGELPADCLKDKLVVIGITTMGLHDLRPTAFDPIFPGVELHCTVMENILQQQFVRKSDRTSLLYDLGAIVALALLFLIAQWHLRGMLLACVTAALAAVYVAITHYLFLHDGLWLNNVYPGLNLVFAYVGTTMHRYVSEEREKRKVRQTFGLYVPPAVVEEMLADPEKLRLGGERKELSILFSDIRGFTTLSEKIPPEELVPQLNSYLTRMTEVVFNHQGTLDKYIGDAIMAIFGAPLPQDNHPVRACQSALDMKEELLALQAEWRSRKMPVLDIGVGIHTGVVMVGNMGSERRFDYTVIGDNVNLASRLEGLTRKYGVSIIVSGATWDVVKNDFMGRELDLVRVKGKQDAVAIFELLCRRDREEEYAVVLDTYSRALALFRERRWLEALELFSRVESIWPGDHPSMYYQYRCGEYLNEPPPENWDYITTLDSK